MVHTPTAVDDLDVSDICDDFDLVVVLEDDEGSANATTFVRRCEDTAEETIHDINEYPAIVAVASRAFEQHESLFENVACVELTYD